MYNTEVWCNLGMGKGPKRTLELNNYGLESRLLTDPNPQVFRLGYRLDAKPGSTKPLYAIIEKMIDLTIDFKVLYIKFYFLENHFQ